MGSFRAGLATILALAAAGAALPAMAREDFSNAFFVRRGATASEMFKDRSQCTAKALDLGDSAAEYSDPQYGALSAMGDALDEDQLHDSGLRKRLRRAILDHCMEQLGWAPLDPERGEAKAIAKASPRKPEALDAWLTAHEPPPAPEPAATAAATTTSAPAKTAAQPAASTAPVQAAVVLKAQE